MLHILVLRSKQWQGVLRLIHSPSIFLLCLASCNNNGKTTGAICDTTCKSDSIKFNGSDSWNQSLAISLRDCRPDTLKWTHGKLKTTRQIQLADFVGQDVKLNPKAV